MTDQQTVKRRHFLANPGDEPLLTTDLIDYHERYERFVEGTGIDPSRVVATPVVKFPLPVAFKDANGNLERWTGIEPSMMWLPLFWLPPHLALRYKYRVIDAETGGTNDDLEVESDDVWAIRVMLELVYAGLYNPVDGTWGDVLSFYGLDIDNPVDQARVQLWLAGHPDEVLDAIDLTDHIVHVEDPEWGLRSARELATTLVPAQWSLSASGLLIAAKQYLDDRGDTDRNRRDMITVLGSVAVNSLRTIPADDSGVPISDVIEAVVAEVQQPDSDSAYLLDTFLQALSEVSDDFAPFADSIAQASAQALNHAELPVVSP